MRRPSTIKHRTRARRAAERALGRRAGAADALAPEEHAKHVAELYLMLRKLDQQRARVLAAYNSALLAARRDQVAYVVLGDAILVAANRPRTAEDLARIETSLRVATHTAVKRVNSDQLASAVKAGDGKGVRLLKRVVTEIYECDDDRDERGIADMLADHDLDVDLDETDDERRADSAARED